MEDFGISESTGGVVQEMTYDQISEIQPKQEKKIARNSHEYKMKRAALEKRVAQLVESGESARSIVQILAGENVSHPSGGTLNEAYVYSIKQALAFKQRRAEAPDRPLKSLSEQAVDYVNESSPQAGPGDGTEIPCAILRSEMSDEKKVRMLKAFFLEA